MQIEVEVEAESLGRTQEKGKETRKARKEEIKSGSWCVTFLSWLFGKGRVDDEELDDCEVLHRSMNYP